MPKLRTQNLELRTSERPHDGCSKKSVISDPAIRHQLNRIMKLSHTHALRSNPAAPRTQNQKPRTQNERLSQNRPSAGLRTYDSRVAHITSDTILRPPSKAPTHHPS